VRLRQVIRLLVPNGLSVGVGYAGIILDTAFASTVPGTMALPAIQNALLLINLPTSLIGQSVGQAAFPRLAFYAAANQWRRMRRTLIWALSAVTFLACPAFLGLALLGRVVIRVLFEHGRFSAAAGTLTYHVLLAYVFVIPFGVATEVTTRGLIALRDARTPLLTNLMQLAGRAAFMAVFIGSMGVIAIPIAFLVSGAIETVLLVVILLTRVGKRIEAAQVGEPPECRIAS
jgi:putative peptidoglycan lipid II flippase